MKNIDNAYKNCNNRAANGKRTSHICKIYSHNSHSKNYSTIYFIQSYLDSYIKELNDSKKYAVKIDKTYKKNYSIIHEYEIKCYIYFYW